MDMPDSEVISYLRDTPNRVKSLCLVHSETLETTNPIIGWMSDCVKFNEKAITQVGTKEVITKTSSGGDCDKVTIREYAHWDSRLYPSYCAWSERSGKQPIALQTFTRTVIDCAKNLLGHTFVKKERQAQGAMIRGLELCRLNVDLNAVYPIDYDENVGYVDLKESASNGNHQETGAPDGFSRNCGVYEDSLHGIHHHKNQSVKQHKGLHEGLHSAKPGDDDDDVEYF